MDKQVSIIGAGLSGCEAALVLARNGFQVTLYDQKPSKLDSAYVFPSFAELVCNNMFGPWDSSSPLGLLLSELSILKSPLLEIAGSSRLQDNSFFSVDKEGFSQKVMNALNAEKIKIICSQVTTLPETGPVILATGPLTNDRIVADVSRRTQANGFHFADASSIVVDIRSIDTSNPHFLKLSDDLYIVKLDLSELHEFFTHLINGKLATTHIPEDLAVFEECEPLEKIAKKSEESLILRKFTTPIMSGICFLLRRENGLENGFILSGFMTTLRRSDQKRTIMSLPGFSNARIIKYGRAHRNTFFDSPRILNEFYKVTNHDLYIIGQLSGVDGYVPCISSGYVAAQRIIHGEHLMPFPKDTMIGALAHYISNKAITEFTPTGPSLSLFRTDLATTDYYTRSIKSLKEYMSTNLEKP